MTFVYAGFLYLAYLDKVGIYTFQGFWSHVHVQIQDKLATKDCKGQSVNSI
jgi:hypothetical protein